MSKRIVCVVLVADARWIDSWHALRRRVTLWSTGLLVQRITNR